VLKSDYFMNLLLRLTEVIIPLIIVLYLVSTIGAEKYGVFAAQYVWYVGIVFFINLGFDIGTSDLINAGVPLRLITKSVLLVRFLVSLFLMPFLLKITDLSFLTLAVVLVDSIFNTRFLLLNNGWLDRLFVPTVIFRVIHLIAIFYFSHRLTANLYVISFAVCSVLISAYIWIIWIRYNNKIPRTFDRNVDVNILSRYQKIYGILLNYTPLQVSNYFLLRGYLLIGGVILPSASFAHLELLDRFFSMLKLPINSVAEVFLAKTVVNKKEYKLRKIHGVFLLALLLIVGNLAIGSVLALVSDTVNIFLMRVWFSMLSILLFAEGLTNFFHMPGLIVMGKRKFLVVAAVISALVLAMLAAILYTTQNSPFLLVILLLPYFLLVCYREFFSKSYG
jgi:PST family polysaccharide transporter